MTGRDGRCRERVTATADPDFVDFLTGSGVQDREDPGVVDQIRTAFVHDGGWRVARGPWMAPGDEIIVAHALGERDVTRRAGLDGEERPVRVALRAGSDVVSHPFATGDAVGIDMPVTRHSSLPSRS